MVGIRLRRVSRFARRNTEKRETACSLGRYHLFLGVHFREESVLQRCV